MRREQMLDRLRAGERWDLVVIGGGATGLGTALDAASRGHRTALFESQDFGKGTSSRSTKLIHGGVRYLARGELGLVREALSERSTLLRNAPHLVSRRRFLVPSYSRWATPYYGIGLKLYEWLAGRHSLGRSKVVSRSGALGLLPNLVADRLRGGVTYVDGQFDDSRLAIALSRTAIDRGGVALNYTPVVGLDHAGGRLRGVVARDAETGETFAIESRAVVNATGVFADSLRSLDEPGAPPVVRPSQGAHVVLDRSFLDGDTALMVPKTDDGRVIFAIPWHGRVVVGTTDTPVDRAEAEPRPLASEVDYLLDHASRYLARAPRRGDVRSAFAGLRPLIDAGGHGPTARLSRDHAVFVSGSGLVTIVGGKWTTYRRMASDAVDRAAEVGGLPRRPCPTHEIVLHGGEGSNGRGELSLYGSEAPDVERVLRSRPGWDDRLHPDLPYRLGEVAWAARNEAARTVEDVLARRTRALFLDARAAVEAAPRVAAVLAEELGRGPDWREAQVASFGDLAAGYLP